MADANGPILLCLGDIFYLTRGLDRMVARFKQGDVAAVIAVMEDHDPASLRKNFSVEIDEGSEHGPEILVEISVPALAVRGTTGPCRAVAWNQLLQASRQRTEHRAHHRG